MKKIPFFLLLIGCGLLTNRILYGYDFHFFEFELIKISGIKTIQAILIFCGIFSICYVIDHKILPVILSCLNYDKKVISSQISKQSKIIFEKTKGKDIGKELKNHFIES